MIRKVLLTSGCLYFTLMIAMAAAAEPQLSWRQTETSIGLLNHGQMVWQHDHDKKVGKPYMRFGLLDGTELTRPWPFSKDYPKNDHTWHRALWWSFKAIDGVNYWEEHQQGTEPTQVDITHEKDGSARIAMTLEYHLPDQPPVVIEHRVIGISAPDAIGTYLIDWQATFTPAGEKGDDKDVVLNQNSYGGFALRMAAECCGDEVAGIPGWTFFDSENQKSANGQAARWVGYQGTTPKGRPAVIAIFDHPANPRHPSYWQTRAQYPYLNPSFTCKEDYTLRAGKSLTLRYGVLVHDGPADAETIESHWKAFADRAGLLCCGGCSLRGSLLGHNGPLPGLSLRQPRRPPYRRR